MNAIVRFIVKSGTMLEKEKQTLKFSFEQQGNFGSFPLILPNTSIKFYRIYVEYIFTSLKSITNCKASRDRANKIKNRALGGT